MQVVTVNETTYLAETVETDEKTGNLLIQDASRVPNAETIEARDIATHLRKKNLDTLKNAKVGGAVAVAQRDLTAEEQIIANDLKAKFRLATERAMPTLVNDQFKQIAGV